MHFEWSSVVFDFEDNPRRITGNEVAENITDIRTGNFAVFFSFLSPVHLNTFLHYLFRPADAYPNVLRTNMRAVLRDTVRFVHTYDNETAKVMYAF